MLQQSLSGLTLFVVASLGLLPVASSAVTVNKANLSLAWLNTLRCMHGRYFDYSNHA